MTSHANRYQITCNIQIYLYLFGTIALMFKGFTRIIQLDFMESSEYLRSSIQLNRTKCCLCFIHMTETRRIFRWIKAKCCCKSCVFEYTSVWVVFSFFFRVSAHLFQWMLSAPIQMILLIENWINIYLCQFFVVFFFNAVFSLLCELCYFETTRMDKVVVDDGRYKTSFTSLHIILLPQFVCTFTNNGKVARNR